MTALKVTVTDDWMISLVGDLVLRFRSFEWMSRVRPEKRDAVVVSGWDPFARSAYYGLVWGDPKGLVKIDIRRMP